MTAPRYADHIAQHSRPVPPILQPAPGSFVVYYIVDGSFIVMRGPDGVLRGFHNSCPHRGRQLLAGQGHV